VTTQCATVCVWRSLARPIDASGGGGEAVRDEQLRVAIRTAHEAPGQRADKRTCAEDTASSTPESHRTVAGRITTLAGDRFPVDAVPTPTTDSRTRTDSVPRSCPAARRPERRARHRSRAPRRAHRHPSPAGGGPVAPS